MSSLDIGQAVKLNVYYVYYESDGIAESHES